MGSPHFCLGMSSCLMSCWFSSTLVKFCTGVVRELGHHNVCSPLDPWGLNREYSTSKWMTIQHWRAWHSGECTLISYPSGLATTFQFCEQSWWSSSPLSAGIYGLTSIPPPNTCEPASHSVKEDIHAHYTLPGIFTHLQWMLQLTSMGEAVASHLSTPGKSS